MKVVNGVGNLLLTLIASIVLILIGIVYFMITIWMIKIGAQWAGFHDVEGTTVVLTAGIVTAASMIGSALQK
ncbi:MAG: hypothetical protein ACMXYE_03330 [Candidatus Woesearchaeota archaeon]